MFYQMVFISVTVEFSLSERRAVCGFVLLGHGAMRYLISPVENYVDVASCTFTWDGPKNVRLLYMNAP